MPDITQDEVPARQRSEAMKCECEGSSSFDTQIFVPAHCLWIPQCSASPLYPSDMFQSRPQLIVNLFNVLPTPAQQFIAVYDGAGALFAARAASNSRSLASG